MPAVASTRTAITGIPAVPDLIWTSFRAFGTFGALLVTRQDAAEAALDILGRELRAIDLACSRFRPDSEVSMLNRDSGRQHNSAHRLHAVWHRFTVPAPLSAGLTRLSGPVLLVDDLVDTGWTLTVAAKLLREAGAPAVLPLVLAMASG